MEFLERKNRVIEVDQRAIDSKIRNANREAIGVNATLKKVEVLIGEPLTQLDRIKLFRIGFDYVMSRVERRYPFPKAPAEDNWRLMGIEPYDLELEVRKSLSIFASNGLEVTDAGVGLTNNGIQLIKDEHILLATDEVEHKALDFAEKLSVFLNENSAEMRLYCGLRTGTFEAKPQHESSNVHEYFQVVKPVFENELTPVKFEPYAQGILSITNSINR